MKDRVKLQVGDPVLVTGPAHYEKTKVISIEKGLITLENQMVIDREFNNVKHSVMVAEPWDEIKYKFHRATHRFPNNLAIVREHFKDLSPEEAILLNSKLEHFIIKFNMKEI